MSQCISFTSSATFVLRERKLSAIERYLEPLAAPGKCRPNQQLPWTTGSHPNRGWNGHARRHAPCRGGAGRGSFRRIIERRFAGELRYSLRVVPHNLCWPKIYVPNFFVRARLSRVTVYKTAGRPSTTIAELDRSGSAREKAKTRRPVKNEVERTTRIRGAGHPHDRYVMPPRHIISRMSAHTPARHPPTPSLSAAHALSTLRRPTCIL